MLDLLWVCLWEHWMEWKKGMQSLGRHWETLEQHWVHLMVLQLVNLLAKQMGQLKAQYWALGSFFHSLSSVASWSSQARP